MFYFANPAGARVVDFQRQRMRYRPGYLGSASDSGQSDSGLWTGLGIAFGAVIALSWFAVSSSRSRKLSANREVYAIPERRAYPITTAADAYRATQRLKQGRVKDRKDAERIYRAIRRRHPSVYQKYLKSYPISKIMESKRRGQIARRRAA